MKTIDMNGLCAKVETESLNFVAFILTPWHLVGAKATYHYLVSQGKSLRPIYVVIPHPDQGVLLKDVNDVELYIFEETLSTLIPGHKKEYLSFMTQMMMPKKTTGEELYIAVNILEQFYVYSYQLSSLNRPIKYLLYEEGLKTYIEKYYSWRYVWEKSHSVPETLRRAIENVVCKHFIRNGEIKVLHPLDVNNGKLSINKESVEYYKKSLNILPINLESKKVILILQAPKDYGMKLLKEIVPILLANDFKVYVKPHPRFPLDVSIGNVEMLDSKKAIEDVQKELKAKYVVGFTSTALLSMNYLFGCKTVSLANMYSHGELPDYVEKAFISFKNQCENICKFPSNKSDFKKEFV